MALSPGMKTAVGDEEGSVVGAVGLIDVGSGVG